MSQSVKEIHRAMYAPAAAEKALKVTRCAIEPRVGPKWQYLQDKCAPSTSEACGFETVKITDMQGNLSDPFDHSKPKMFGEGKGWTHMGGGRGRETFEFKPGCVVKFARSDRVDGKVVGARPWEGALSEAMAGGKHLTGTEQNTYEVATFNSCADNIKELMVPIVAHSPKAPYKWLVLPKAEVAGSGSHYRWDSVADDLDEMLAERGAKVIDLHGGNVGKIEGNPVLVDYGFRTKCPVQKSGDKAVAKKLTEFFGKPQDIPAAQQAEPSLEPEPEPERVCDHHFECGHGQMCVNGTCKDESKVTRADILEGVRRANEYYKTVAPSYRTDIREDFDEALNQVERYMNNDNFNMALWKLEEAHALVADQRNKLERLGISTYRTPKPVSPKKPSGGLAALFPPSFSAKAGPQDKKKAKVVADMARIVSLQGRSMDAAFMREQAKKIREFGAGAVRPADSTLMMKILDTSHKRQIAEIGARGRHGLRRPRAGAVGELTQKRRVLWARAGELRRHAKGHRTSEKQEMIDAARFLEQQAWHYQTKQMKSGKAPLSDPGRMIRLLHPEQRSYFPAEKLEYG